jgi:hypothetical protein
MKDEPRSNRVGRLHDAGERVRRPAVGALLIDVADQNGGLAGFTHAVQQLGATGGEASGLPGSYWYVIIAQPASLHARLNSVREP